MVPSNALSACHVTVERTIAELSLYPDGTTVEPPEVAATAVGSLEVSVVSTCQSSSCPVTAMEAICESSSCPFTAMEAICESSSCPVMAKETVCKSSFCPVTAMEAYCKSSSCHG